MKALLRICLPLCIFSFIAFGLTCIFIPREGNAERGEASYTFEESFDNIRAETGSYGLTITPWSESYTSVDVDEEIKDKVLVNLDGDTLVITSRLNFDWFRIGNYNLAEWLERLVNGELFDEQVTVKVPEKTYEKLELNCTSGSISSEFVAAKDVSLKLTSGSVDYYQPAGHKADRIDLHETSGSATLKNAMTDEYSVHITSGEAMIYSLTGKGRVEMTSGSADLEYAELNGDCYLKTTSGRIDVRIPDDSSAVINPSVTSGMLYVNVGGVEAIGDSHSSGQNIKIGSGKYNITAKMTSGSIDIFGLDSSENNAAENNAAVTTGTSATAYDDMIAEQTENGTAD